MRPNPSQDPSVELVEEPSNVGSFVILTPTPQQWIQILDQLFGLQRYVPLRPLSHLVHETTDRLLARIGIQRTRTDPATNLALGEIEFPLPALDLVAQEDRKSTRLNSSHVSIS